MTPMLVIRDYLDSSLQSSLKGYRRSYDVVLYGRESVLVHCDLCGYPEGSEVPMSGPDNASWFMRPNRKIMPSVWTVTEPDGQPVWRIERASAVRLMNPLERQLLTVIDVRSGRNFVLKNLTKSRVDLALGPRSTKWHLMENNVSVAALARVSDSDDAASGIRGALRRFFSRSYWALACAGDRPVLEAPAFLGMMLLYRRLTDSS